jgi:Rieske Fe-S protein
MKLIEKKLTRKRFMKLALLSGSIGSLFSFIYPVISYLIPPRNNNIIANSIVAAKSDEIESNNFKIVRFGRKPVIVIRIESGELKAFSAVCTHLSCIVQYRPDLKHIWCACHDGHYNLKGINIAGPPPRPLKEFNVNEISGKIIVSKAL